MWISRAPLIYAEDFRVAEASLKGMGTSGCGVAHYTLITIPPLKVRSTEHLIRALYINRANVAAKSVNCNLTWREKANNKRKSQSECGQRDGLRLAEFALPSKTHRNVYQNAFPACGCGSCLTALLQITKTFFRFLLRTKRRAVGAGWRSGWS